MRWLATIATVLFLGCSAKSADSPALDAGHDASSDARTDAKSDVGDGASEDAADTSPFPPPMEDAAEPDYGAPPAPGTHVEATIGPAGGVLAGASGTPLADVSLEVPMGALAAPTLLAIDLDVAPTLPSGATALSPFVRIGPDGTAFSVPARLTLPCNAIPAAASIAGLARVGASWSSLLDPAFDAGTQRLSASMSRASGGLAASIPGALSPAIAGFSPTSASVGSIVFVDGSGFGLAPAWLDAGASRSSQVFVGSAMATVLGWSDASISFRVPSGATSGAITVRTTQGQATTSTPLVVQ